MRTLEPPTLEGEIEIEGETRLVRLVLPPSYPGVPPLVREIDPESRQEVAPAGRANRLIGHGICLFPHGSDPQAWRQDRRAVEALHRFEEFIRRESNGPGIHRASDRVFISAAVLDLMLELGPGRVVMRRSQAGGDLFADAIEFDNRPELNYNALPDHWRQLLGATVEVPWVVLSTDEPWTKLAGSRELLDATLRQLPEAHYRRVRAEVWLLLVRGSRSGAEPATEVACVHRPPQDVRMLLELDVIRATPGERLYQRLDGVLDQRNLLVGETVVMVGLGSLGGSIALALARAGVRKFVLIDPDRLAIENVCRHVGTVRDLGRAKVMIVKDAIMAINPDAEVRVFENWLAWDLPWLSAGPQLEQICAEEQCTIVSTCAEESAEQQLNVLSLRHGTPVVYAAALGAAEHGRIFRVVPERAPCWQCVVTAQNAHPDRYPRFALPGPGAETPAPYVDPSLPGLGIDIAQIASITARYTLQTIAQVRGFELGYPDEPGDHLLWTNRGGWLFDRPLQLIVERFPRDPECVVCGSGRPSGTLDADEQRELEALITKLSPEVR